MPKRLAKTQQAEPLIPVFSYVGIATMMVLIAIYLLISHDQAPKALKVYLGSDLAQLPSDVTNGRE